MPTDDPEAKLGDLIADSLNIPVSDPRFLPAVEEIIKLVGESVGDNECLRRYREVRERMGKDTRIFMAAPNFPYTTHSA